MRQRLTTLLFIALLGSPALAVSPETAQKIHKEASPSLVAVQYTYEGELGRQELTGAGVIVSDDGLVMMSISVTPTSLPDEQLKSFKILIPGDEEKEFEATFIGRDERSSVAFVKAKPKESDKDKDKTTWKWKPIKFEDVPVNIGEEIVSIGLLGKTAAYQSYFTTALVSANLRGEIKHILATDGLAAVGSPVFNAKGQAIGWVHMQMGQQAFLNDNDPQAVIQSLYIAPRTFVPTREFSRSLANPPVAGEPLKLPWMGVAQMNGLKKDEAEFFGLQNKPAIQVGDVIPGTAADKAGLKRGNIIVAMNGKDLERGDVPDEAALILARQVRWMKPGDQVTFSVITEPNKPPAEINMTLTERPTQENKAKRFFAEDLGFTARDIVFDDTYNRKLPADTKGVVIALVKRASAAQSGKLRNGDLVTRLNQTAITGVDQFKQAYEEFRKQSPKEAVVLEVIRQGQDEIIRIEPPR
jgi:serine protease Do